MNRTKLIISDEAYELTINEPKDKTEIQIMVSDLNSPHLDSFTIALDQYDVDALIKELATVRKSMIPF